MALTFCEEYIIKANNTVQLIAEIKDLYIKDDIVEADGFVNLAKANIVAINGLDGYALDKFPLGLNRIYESFFQRVTKDDNVFDNDIAQLFEIIISYGTISKPMLSRRNGEAKFQSPLFNYLDISVKYKFEFSILD